MCGIAGWLGAVADGENYATRMAQRLHHRGPDGRGMQSWPEATLVHTRLSIIDLSPTGAQPMSNEAGTVWTVFNGEIYNHRELRRGLESRGHRFNGRSDTEVIPHLYEEKGADFITELRGMFALALYDTRNRTFILARDRFGIKPLFYAPGNKTLAFASEIRALFELPDIDTQPNPQAIYDFMALSYIPAPETFYVGIQALQPGEILEAQLDAHGVVWKTRPYHRWAITPNSAITLDQAAEQADDLLRVAVGRQMESDVPLGALLSGGIDSSLVSAAAQVALDGKLQTFNERFAETKYDETAAAVAVAEHIASHHHTLDMEEVPGTWSYVQDLIQHAGQPFADTSLFAVYALCRLIRQYVTVVVSGDGGDEGFGGYDFYGWLNPIVRWQATPTSIQRSSAVALNLLSRLGAAPRRLMRTQDLTSGDDTSILHYLLCPVRETEHTRLCRNMSLQPIRRLFEPQWDHHLPPNASRLERLSAQATEVDVRLRLANDYLFKVDTASMKQSLEVRVPMLDEDLFAFGLSLPYHLKVKRQMRKRVLRTVAQRRLPRAVANKPKRGFVIPLDTWTDTNFKIRLRDTLLGPASRLPAFFHKDVYQPMVMAFCNGQPYPGISRGGLCRRVIMLLSVQFALERS